MCYEVLQSDVLRYLGTKSFIAFTDNALNNHGLIKKVFIYLAGFGDQAVLKKMSFKRQRQALLWKGTGEYQGKPLTIRRLLSTILRKLTKQLTRGFQHPRPHKADFHKFHAKRLYVIAAKKLQNNDRVIRKLKSDEVFTSERLTHFGPVYSSKIVAYLTNFYFNIQSCP